MVGVTGFEPVASWSRTKRDTKLRHTPKAQLLYAQKQHLSRSKNFFTPKHRNTAVFFSQNEKYTAKLEQMCYNTPEVTEHE